MWTITAYLCYHVDVIYVITRLKVESKTHLLRPQSHGHGSGLILTAALILWCLPLKAVHDQSIDRPILDQRGHDQDILLLAGCNGCVTVMFHHRCDFWTWFFFVSIY